MNSFNNDTIQDNNDRIFHGFVTQPRFIPETRSQKSAQHNTNSDSETCEVSDCEKRVLMVLYNDGQFRITLTELQKLTGLSVGTFSRTLNKCVKKNLVKVLQPPFSKGRPQYAVLLQLGYKALGVKEIKFNGRGAGYEHTLYQHLIANHFQNFKPVIELNRNGKFIDVIVETNEILISMEIAMTSVHEKENIEKDIAIANADFVIIACINEKIKKEVQNIVLQLNENIRNKTEIWLISELLKKNPDELINSHQLKINF